ncbi:hypothetical protein PMKS-002604 [Pichia membranifaciens]|uniref:Pre-rRNA-processing protein RIX1 N-terminal domain-containing protein n=1 Tax=Pichia membranifaciens TaxID=4926 RepID=A0A1Q2YHV4_9ASCO|nr:hypothetical protein PMKS-002604 [Pichia membranifaciens]
MIPTLQTVLPYIQEDALGDVPLTLLLKLLANPSIINSASTVNQETLLTRISTLLKSNHSIIRWKATKLITVSLTHPVLLLSSHTTNVIASLVKILESKCFIANYENPGQRELVTLRSTADCLGFVLDQIRGKPTLTREVLTPKLPGIIGSLIEVIVLIPESTIPVLSKLLITNTTTFRPFGAKLETALRNILNNGQNWSKLDSDLRSMVLESLALVSFILSREKQANFWRENVDSVILEIKSVISIYEAFLELSNDSEYIAKFNSLPKLPENMSTSKLIFGSLSIDINETPIAIFKVSQRIEILSDLLLAYVKITTPSAVTVPFGNYITIAEILGGLNVNYTPVKRDIRDVATIELIEQSVLEAKLSGIKMLQAFVEKFPGELYPHMYEILALLDAAIPVQTYKGKIKVDKKAVYEHESLSNCILQTASVYLSLTERFNDMTVLGRLVEAALILKETREPIIPTENKTTAKDKSSNGSRKKGSKNKSAISLSDILSHQQLFEHPPSATTLHVLRKFFNVLLTKCELSPGKLSLVLRFVIIDAVANLNAVRSDKSRVERKDVLQLLESALLFPGKANNSISIIPLVANLIGSQSPIFSLLTNPRFPLLQKKISGSNFNDDENGSTEEEETEEAAKFEKGEFPTPGSVSEKRAAEGNFLVDTRKTKKQHTEDDGTASLHETADQVFGNEKEATDMLKKLKDELKEEKSHPQLSLADDVAAHTEVAEDNDVALSERDENEEDMGSDFEIPEINVDDE